MGYSAPNLFSLASPNCVNEQKISSTFQNPRWKNSLFQNHSIFRSNLHQLLVFSYLNESGDRGNAVKETENPKRKWVKKNPNLTEEQKQAISQLPSKMTNRCKALMKQIICFSTENGSVDSMLAAWVKSTKPRRADWLSVLKELEMLNHPLYFEVFEHAFTQESFEANIRDYTKIIHGYAKQNMLREAEHALTAMKNRGFICDQVTLTALVHMYSKAGNLKMAEDSFEEMRLLGVPLDKRSYGSMIMAYIRAEMFDSGEQLLREMEAQEIYAGKEVYKALLRAYSMGLWASNKRYVASGKNREACVAFENMRKCGIEPNDKCVALVLAAYEKDNRLKEALNLLIELETNGFVLGKESSGLLVKWFQKLGVVDEVEVVLRDFALRMP
ncbi:hypothetical protein DH2020_032451 [Rehmannia glutinosa]|uniref:PROP1-like PPR domain-containing protein n=1 Tax=Rehmannia glutinosa TaxID=99300 RepID=A0ABR0VH89_REHGL